MKQTLLTAILVIVTGMAMAQTKPKEYAQPNPNKLYTFTLTIQASKLNDLGNLLQQGSISIMDTDIQAKLAKSTINNSFDILTQLSAQLRKQIVADSLVNINFKKQP